MSVTRNEFDALAARVAALEGVKPPSTPVTDVWVSPPTVTVDGATYTVEATIKSATAVKLTYLQLAVRGPGATDLALSPNTQLAADQTKTLKGSGRGQNGSYTAYLAFSKDGQTWVDGPKATFTVAGLPVDTTPPPSTGPRKVPLVNKSGLGFNSLVFRQTREEMLEFGRRRGVPMDGLLYFTPRQNWQDLRYHPNGQRQMLEEGLIVVTSYPHAPESEGDAMNQRGANDGYKTQQRELGKWLADNGYNRPNHVQRIDWEANGNWYKWSANRPGGPAALREAIKNCVNNLRAGGLTKTPFDLCYNKGPNQSGAAFEFFPGPEWIDIIGIDQYDMWSPSFNQSDWEREMAKGPSARICAELAKKHGIMWSWDEGGNTHGDRNQGGDNPFYWEMRRKEIARNIANLAYDVTYDHPGAPATLRHDFATNPKSWPVYKRLWTPS
jgi:hypothetical protein